jgi:hypothetical protein
MKLASDIVLKSLRRLLVTATVLSKSKVEPLKKCENSHE